MSAKRSGLGISLLVCLVLALSQMGVSARAADIGQEVAVPKHLQDGEEYTSSLRDLVKQGETLFKAVWTIQEGGGRPLTKGTGAPLSDPASPLEFPRNFNRVSAPDANSCAGCHNAPFGIAGGGGDIVANVFVLGQRFDFATFDNNDLIPTRGGVDELGNPVLLQTIANSRNTLGMFGSGYIEMLAREITTDLQAIRDATPLGGTSVLTSKGISYGTITHNADGTWDVSGVQGISPKSLITVGPTPPSLVIRAFHQVSNVVSIREFSNNAFNHHHGIQSEERFGIGVDQDGDGFVNEMTRADVTAASVFQATLAVPGQVIPKDKTIKDAIATGADRFNTIGCATCHIPSLPLKSHIFVEPNPFNPVGNLRPGDAPDLSVDLNDGIGLPTPRLTADRKTGITNVPAFTDLKLHDITCGPGDPNIEALDHNQPAGSPGFFAGNSRFITRKLWGTGNEPPFYHHGQYTTIRQAVLAHCGEALAPREAYEALTSAEQDDVIEFLKSLQVLCPGSKQLVAESNDCSTRSKK